jgi:hypothetical protein
LHSFDLIAKIITPFLFCAIQNNDFAFSPVSNQETAIRKVTDDFASDFLLACLCLHFLDLYIPSIVSKAVVVVIIW